MRWGLVGFGSAGPDPKRATFNARSDNLERSSLWRTPLHKRRCLVPVSGYFEWRKSDKVPFRFTLSDQPLYAFAGLWDAWKSPAGDWLQSFSVITVEANTAMRTIHDRMPAILRPQDYDEWLDRGEVERPPTHLLRLCCKLLAWTGGQRVALPQRSSRLEFEPFTDDRDA
jgi:putative SOS response-associated peptidase YedK